MAHRSRHTHKIMETANPFNLNQAILDWRKALADAPAIRRGDLDELESHLRDSVASLEAAGLAPHEAFWVAQNRLGAGEALNAEFGKVNTEQVWADRVLWMVTGCIVLGLASSLINGLVALATLGMFKLTTPSILLGPGGLVLHLATLAGFLLFLWQSGRSTNGLVWRAGRWLKTRPRTAVAIAFVLPALASCSVAGAQVLTVKLMSIQTYSSLLLWRWPAGIAVGILWPIVLAWLLTRKCANQGPPIANSRP